MQKCSGIKELTDQHRELVVQIAKNIDETPASATLPKCFLVCVDGASGAGKSTVARFLSWQLDAEMLPLDLYIKKPANPLARVDYCIPSVKKHLEKLERRNKGKIVVIEGLTLLHVLQDLGRNHDFLVYIRNPENQEVVYRKQCEDYDAIYSPTEKSNFIFNVDQT